MAVVGKGTESLGTPELVPRAQILNTKATRRAGVPVPTPPGESGLQSIWFIAAQGSATRNISGEEITVKELETINSNFNNPIYVLPGAADDYNNIQWKFPVPSNMKDGSAIRIVLHLITL